MKTLQNFVFVQIFFGVFVFGVFQGLVFLPVALSFFGPPPYNNADKTLVKGTDTKQAAAEEDIELSDEEWRQQEPKS